MDACKDCHKQLVGLSLDDKCGECRAFNLQPIMCLQNSYNSNISRIILNVKSPGTYQNSWRDEYRDCSNHS